MKTTKYKHYCDYFDDCEYYDSGYCCTVANVVEDIKEKCPMDEEYNMEVKENED